MNYNPKFLELGPSKPIPVGFGSLEPESALSLPKINITTYAFTRGFHCYNCGRLSCRYSVLSFNEEFLIYHDSIETNGKNGSVWTHRAKCVSFWAMLSVLSIFSQASMKISGSPREAASLLHQTSSITFKDYALNPISGTRVIFSMTPKCSKNMCDIDIQQLLPASFKHDKGRGLVQTFILPYEKLSIRPIVLLKLILLSVPKSITSSPEIFVVEKKQTPFL